MTKINTLIDKLETTKDKYANTGMHFINCKINKFEFFPGGAGLVNTNTLLNKIDYIFVGNDFGLLKDYESYSDNSKYEMVTLSNLYSFLDENKELLDINKIFFTNIILGARDNSQKVTGLSSGAKNSDFVKYSFDFFEDTVSLIKPKAIVLLGKPVMSIFSKRHKHLYKLTQKNFYNIYTENVNFDSIEIRGEVYPVCPLIHPSFRNVNLTKNGFETVNSRQIEKNYLTRIIETT